MARQEEKKRSARLSLSASKRYLRLVRSISQKETKLVISLGGGGVRMFAHAVVFEFLENLGVQKRISEIWGASAGAIVGALYSSGMNSLEIKEEGLKVYNKQYKIPKAPSYLSMASRVIRDAFLPIHRKSIMKRFHDYQMAFLEILGRNIRNRKMRYDFFCTAYNMQTNDNDILTSVKIPESYRLEGLYQVDLLDAATASSAIPIIFLPKVIKDKFGTRKYVDGAMIEDVPTVSLYKKWLHDRALGIEKRRRLLVISVNLHPPFTSMGLMENWVIRRLPGYEYLLLSINCADFMRQARNQAQRRVLMEDPNVELWELNLDMPGGGLLNLDLIPEIIQIAEKSFPQQFAKINKSLLV